MSPRKATHQLTKQHNRDLVLRTVFDNHSISRAEIARVTKLTRATVSDMVSNLIDEGLVEEIGFGESLGGKAPILLSLIADARYLIGLNIAHDKFVGSVVNLRGEIKETVEIPINENDGKQALDVVLKMLDQLTGSPWKPIVGIGVGAPGFINTREGAVVRAVNLDWQNLPLAQIIESRYKLPTIVLNDSQATAIGEFVYGGEHQSEDNLIVISVKHGIGSGILIKGSLFQGDGGGAGEIGHVVVQKNGALCRCGNRGCLETIASAQAVVRRCKELAPAFGQSILAKDPQNITLHAIEEAWQAEDPLASLVIYEAAQTLGTAIANLVAVLNIHKIILTGDMARFGEPWLCAIKEAMSEAAIKQIAEDIQIDIGALDYQACILGASAYMLLKDYSLLYRSN